MRHVALTLLFATGCFAGDHESGSSEAPAAPGTTPAGSADGGVTARYEGHRLSPTRRLRRITLRLRGRQPTAEEYAAVTAAASDEARERVLGEAVESALASVEFYEQMVAFGHEYLNIGDYASGQEKWIADAAAHLSRCAAGSKHPGAYIAIGAFSRAGGDPASFCDDKESDGSDYVPPVTAIEPWWAPGTTVQVLGRAGSGVRAHDGVDCGQTGGGIYDTWLGDRDDDNALCSCGPNLVYCHPYDPGESTGPGYHGSVFTPGAQARQLFEEPARLFAHIAWNDRPFSDLVVGNYSVMPLELRSVYVRQARADSTNAALDDSSWWRPSAWSGPVDPQHAAGDRLAWQEVVLETVHPNYLALSAGLAPSGSLERTYRFDPRTETGNARGVGAAGVLTTFVSTMSFARERVRAARYLETFACRQFLPPPADEKFNAYHRDPATEGVCQHCHTSIDPAAVFFKRLTSNFATPSLAGVGSFEWDHFPDYDGNKKRWGLAFVGETVLTPATTAQIEANAEVRFLDGLLDGQTLFGKKSDGTIGPLGFGKLLVESGELDQCAVQKLHARFGGRALDPASEQPLIDELARQFVKDGRTVRGFVRALFADREKMERGF